MSDFYIFMQDKGFSEEEIDNMDFEKINEYFKEYFLENLENIKK